MLDLRRRERALAVVLSATAGFVDAVGFIEVGGYFVSFMSGNSTRMVVNVAEGDLSGAGIAAMVLVSFFVGAVCGALVTRRRVLDDRPAVLGLVASLLALALVLQLTTSVSVLGVPVGLAVVAAAMGSMNSVFHNGREVSLGVTYMTGAVVKSAHRLVDALLGGAWGPYFHQLALWSALVIGGVLGAVIQMVAGAAALGVAVLVVLCTLIVTVVLRRREYRAP